MLLHGLYFPILVKGEPAASGWPLRVLVGEHAKRILYSHLHTTGVCSQREPDLLIWSGLWDSI